MIQKPEKCKKAAQKYPKMNWMGKNVDKTGYEDEGRVQKKAQICKVLPLSHFASVLGN